MKPIWIVDDDQSIRFVLEKALLREDLPTRSFTNPREVLQALESGDDEDGPQILVSDIRMPGGSGLDLLTKVKEKHPGLPVIIMTAFSDLDSAVSAFQGGAFEYLPKPFDLPKAIELIRRAVEESQREEVAEERMAAAPEMLGQAPAMQDVFRAIGRLSQSNVTVMITGESGSGKELVARALHKHSPRAGGPFVAINTAAIPKDLLESELFGHERGAFTGAQTMRRGRFEQAEGGTLFLDEIGDMPFDLQTRLLRVLSDGAFLSRRRPQRRQGQRARDRGDAPGPGAARQGRRVPRRPVPPPERDPPAAAGAARAPGRHSHAGAPFPAAKRQAAGRGAQAHLRCGAGAAGDLRLSGQRAAAREHLPLAHRDGARAADRTQGPAARSGPGPRRGIRRACGRSRQPMHCGRQRRTKRRRHPTAVPAIAGRSRPVRRSWESGLEAEALELLVSGRHDVGTR